MIAMVTAIELSPWHKGALENLQRLLREEPRTYAGLHRIVLLRDCAHPTHYLIMSEWAGHDELAAAMRAGLVWLHRGWTAEWLAECPRIYDETMEIAETAEGKA